MIDLMEGSGKVISANGILLTTLEGKPFYISCIYNSEERKSLCLAEAKRPGGPHSANLVYMATTTSFWMMVKLLSAMTWMWMRSML